jgi:transcriptional regulator with XRE-family HTH domain
VSRIRDLHTEWMKDPNYRDAYEALEDEFALAAALIRARKEAGLTQEQLASRMGTKQEVVARWEGGKVLPSTRTLTRLAKATGTTLHISFARTSAIATAQRSGKAPRSRAGRRIA